jgi:hypothetical protein
LKTVFFILLVFYSLQLSGQTVVFDRDHLRIVNENGAMRNSSELMYQQSLEGIKQNTDDIGVNTASLAMLQTIIHRSLSEVNEALKDAIQVKYIGQLFQMIYTNSNEVLTMASQDPVLLLFAEEYIRQAKAKSLSLVIEVSGFILNRENNLLINHNVRDELLSKVRTELQLINGYMLTIKNSMYWAKMNGVLKRLNPYQAYINQDINLVDRILIQKEILER